MDLKKYSELSIFILELNTNISIYFGEPLPKVINGVITNIEQDMIELTLIPEKDVIYIDFAYSGIPENLNIEKIIIRDQSIPVVEDIDSKDKYEDDKSKEIKYLDLDNTDDLDYDLIINQEHEELHKILLDSIEFEEELEEIFHSVNVSEDEKRYSLEDQLNDYMNASYNIYKPEERNDIVINNINLELNRYIELRNIYSEFDNNKNANIPKERGIYNKPLKELLFKLNKKLYWLLPVTVNKKLVMNENIEDDDFMDDDFAAKHKMGEFIESLNRIINNWSNNNSKEKVNTYTKYINNLLETEICHSTFQRLN